MYDSLAKKMINSGLWAGTPTPNSQAAKKFANDLTQWITDSSAFVREDKVAIA